MVNINAQLPSAIAVPFHPAAESIHSENANKPVIPKTEIISSYQKLRDEQDRNPFSSDARQIIQDISEETAEQSEKQQDSPQQKRARFFALKGKTAEVEASQQSLAGITDFSAVLSVIQLRYRSAVSPFPEPHVSNRV